ncbi:MAG: autotransporter outer membrane beta-barrel domain-containing protein [Gammaproteobacteria bacterium]|nr:autotransporter outer membrane beta-barrel domain-containing protein [Gammaproteobacteria bacterium]
MNKLQLFSFFCLIFVSNSLWAFINIAGNYSGTVSETVTTCPDNPSLNGQTYVTNVDVVLGTPVDDGDGGFDVPVTFSGPGSPVSLPETNASSSLFFDGTSFIAGIFIYGNFPNGTYSNGTITGSGTATSTSIYPTSCNISISFTLTGGGSSNATPAAAINNVGMLTSTIQGMTTIVTSRINTILTNIVRGFSLTGGKPMLSTDLGKAAGDEFEGLSAWASLSGMKLDNNSAVDFDGDRHSIMLGVDYQPRDNMVAGLMLSWETADLDTSFNSGNVQTDGFTIAPYFGMALDDKWSMDAMVGYGRLDLDQFHRGTGGVGPLVTSNTDSQRLFAAANINYGFIYDQFYLEGRGGITSADEQQDSYTESNGSQQRALRTAFTKLQLGGKATYLGFDEFNPYFGLSYNYDISSNSVALFGNNGLIETDRDDMVSSIGFSWQKEENLSAGFEWTHRFMHKNFREDAINLDVRMTF